jgi:DNA invertase Pin-like site-specific DNA recombinase
MNGIIYCRVSSKEQIEGTSLDSQESACREYAKQHGVTVLKTYIERGESAKFADRTQLLELLEYCKVNKNTVHVLLVWKVDRFARNVGDHFNIKALLTKYGVRIVSVTEPIDAKPEGRLMETILAGFAQFDNDVRGVRTVQGMKKRIEDGISPWRPPLGYKTRTQRGDKKTEADVPSEPLFQILRRGWKAYATGSYTKADILRMLTNWGAVNSVGKPLSPQALDYVFRNPFYAGILKNPFSGEVNEGKHQPMVSRQDFARVQRMLNQSNHAVEHVSERPEFPLRGLARCPRCNGFMMASVSRGRSGRYPYYRCFAKCDAGKSYPAANVHAEFLAWLSDVKMPGEVFETLEKDVIENAERRRATAAKQQASFDREIAGLNRQIQTLITMRTQGFIDDQEFLAQKQVILERRDSFHLRHDTPLLAPTIIRGQIEQIKEWGGPLR